MKKLIVVFACIGMCGISLSGQSKSIFMDGDAWLALDKLQDSKWIKVTYMKGLYDGATANFIAAAFMHGDPASKERAEFISEVQKDYYYVMVFGSQYSQIAEGVDEVYLDYANRHIPVFAIATLVNKRIQGNVGEQEFMSILQELRSMQWFGKDR